MNSLNTTTTTGVQAFLLFLGGAIELLTAGVGIPLSVINLCLVARTSVIHPNMKFIIIFQSFFILLRGICRFVICLFKFILWDPISAETTTFCPALQTIIYTCIYSRNFVPHILIIERVLATLFVRSYERRRGFLFSLFWSPFVFAISFYTGFTWSSSYERPLSTLITIVVQLVAGIGELAIFDQLCRHNSNVYQKMLRNDGPHSLSIRYQLSENIRIGKQLIPPLLLNLGNIFAGTIAISWAYFELPCYYQILNLVANVNSLLGLLIELFIITCHPFLKRDLFNSLHGLCHIPTNNNQIGNLSTIVGGISNAHCCSAVGIAQRDLISGKALLIDHSKPEDHFAILKNAWEQPIKNEKL